ncbi:MAG: hypothetical protein WCI18_16510 [Pseudomonadota bacterium]
MNKAKLSYALKRNCPYCGENPLMETWFKLAEGCPKCGIKYARDEAHYSGASQLVAFPIVSLLGLFEGALIWYFFKLDTLVVAMLSFLSMFLFLLLFWPYALAIWTWFEHFVRPVTAESEEPKRF